MSTVIPCPPTPINGLAATHRTQRPLAPINVSPVNAANGDVSADIGRDSAQNATSYRRPLR